ncbi:hypothetical protein J2X31_003002 [Flavobacterium arsenatis]|uniref:Protein BatD n=1 Tax=Flavobacterium arsenatis TaxID=1484332 RepID=A0ABU1TT19_9FLAO|nr:hypothetical protein [Flavobacterium arsenatis]MDR6968976.1 hypothetical protein [Flavobacterium arsenatis]
MKIKFYILLLLFTTTLFAQKRVETSIDTTKNKIGAQFNLTLRTFVDTTETVVFPSGNNFGRMEVIRNYVVDTVKKDNRYELIKKYGLAQFDSGKYIVPSLKVFINQKPYFTDSLSVEVANVPVDTLQQKMYEIKPIIGAESASSGIWKWLLIILALVGIGFLVYYLIKKYQKKKVEQEVYKTPIEKATSLLNTLEKKELWQKGEVKAYYSELTDIARNYIEEAIEIPAMESTTSELIVALRNASQKKKMAVSQETLENLERVLKQADLVKFAKSKPLDFEISEDKKKIEKAILTLDNAIPEEVVEEEDILNEAQRQKLIKEKLRKKRNARIGIAIASVIGLTIGVFTFLVFTKGFDFVKDNLIGHPTKDLVEGEWVLSEYGNPSVRIETPKVLKRIDAKKTLPKEAFAVIKDMQLFGYGSMLDNFYIAVSTLQYKEQMEIDLATALEGSVRIFEAQGAQNMILKQEDFSTKEGITGKKGYGSFSRIDPVQKKSTKLYYEVLIFSQEGGLQQIVILHQEGDKYANEISERILNSVELKKVAQ